MKDRPRLTWAMLAGATVLFTVACMLFTPGGSPLKFEPPVLPDAQVGVPYEARVTISDNATPAGEFSISEGALPKGLALEKVQGENSARVFGTPQEAGTFTFKVFVWCYGTNVSGQVGQKDYSLAVK